MTTNSSFDKPHECVVMNPRDQLEAYFKKLPTQLRYAYFNNTTVHRTMRHAAYTGKTHQEMLEAVIFELVEHNEYIRSLLAEHLDKAHWNVLLQ